MAGIWPSNKHKKLNCRDFLDDENDMLMGSLISQKSGMDFMQNCDLPPPLKVFSGFDKDYSVMGKEEYNRDFDIYGGGGENNEKLELLKALRLSQTRAREAENKAANLMKERDCVCNALLRESMQLFAYRQWVRLLEFQVLKLQSQEKKWWFCSPGRSEGMKELLNLDGGSGCGGCGGGAGDDGMSWIMVLAFCLGIAGVGFAFGVRYLF